MEPQNRVGNRKMAETTGQYGQFSGSTFVCGCFVFLLAERMSHLSEEFVVDQVSRDGVHKTTMIWMYDVQEVNGSYVCTGQRPVASNTPTAESLVTYTRNCLDALGIRNGASHSEVILTADGPCLVEVRCVKEPWESWESQTWIRLLPSKPRFAFKKNQSKTEAKNLERCCVFRCVEKTVHFGSGRVH